MTIKNRFLGLAATVATGALVLSGCGGSDAASEKSSEPGIGAGQKITAAAAYEATNYHPSNTSSALAMGTNWHVVEGLYELDMHDSTPHKALAADDDPVKVSDTEYTVKIRKDAKFSDGTAVTPEDVVKSFERTLDKKNLYYSMLSFIDHVEKKDDTTVTIKLAKPFSLVKERLALVKIVPAAATDEALTKMPIGTGPWKYDSIDTQKVVFSPNPNYNGDHPAKASSMEFQIIKDDTARTTAMQEKSIQAMESVPADVKAQLEAAGITVKAVQGFNLPFLMFNTKKAPFDKKEVRQAFFYAINVPQLIDNAMSGLASPLKSFLPENHPNFHKAKNVYTYDKDKAKKLLAEAGITSLDMTLLTTDHPWIKALAPQIQNDLKEVGINATIQSEASSSLYSNYADPGNYDVVLAPGDPSVFGNDPDLLMNWWYGDNAWTQKRSMWKDSEGYTKLHAILDEATTLSGDKQQEKWNEAFDLLSEEVPLYPLFHRQILTGYLDNQLDGYSPIGTTGLNFIDVNTK